MFVVTLIVDELPLVTLVGLKLAFTPGGRPLALKLTLPENPFVPVTVTLYVVLPPAVTVREVGDGLKEKSGEGGGGGAPPEGRTVMYVFDASINPLLSFTVVQR